MLLAFKTINIPNLIENRQRQDLAHTRNGPKQLELGFIGYRFQDGSLQDVDLPRVEPDPFQLTL